MKADLDRLYPIPDQVGCYGGKDEFLKSRKESAAWIHWQDNVKHILNNQYQLVKPLHIELSPTYHCNFNCSWCNTKRAMADNKKKCIQNSLNLAQMKKIIAELAQYQIGIQWAGGEPLANKDLIQAIEYANQSNLKQCIFTNGSLLSQKIISHLLENELVFIRMSLNAISPPIHADFHNYNPALNYIQSIKESINYLCREKQAAKSQTQIGFSFVIDERNINDINNILDYFEDLLSTYDKQIVDYLIIRPAFKFDYNTVHLESNSYARLFSQEGLIEQRLNQYGVKVVIPRASLEQERNRICSAGSKKCIASGWFSEIKPDGSYVICSDHYGNDDYVIGNLLEQSIDQIWESEQRFSKIRQTEKQHCFKKYCPQYGRGYLLNSVFYEIEQFRKAGRLDQVEKWINDLRKVIQKPGHSFFI